MISVINIRQPIYITLESEDGSEQVEINSIQYMELHCKKMHFHINPDKEVVMKMSMKQLCSLIKDDERFVLVNSGTLVNTNYIKAYTRKNVTLHNGIKLSIARSRYEFVKEGILLNWSKKKYQRKNDTV